MVAYTPNILLANPSQPFKTLPEMVAYARANPGKLTYASFGTGTTSHMAGEMLKSVAGIDILHVPYKGAGEAIPALLSGQVSMYFDTIMTGLPQAKSGALLALGMSNSKRSALRRTSPRSPNRAMPATTSRPGTAWWRPKARPPRCSTS